MKAPLAAIVAIAALAALAAAPAAHAANDLRFLRDSPVSKFDKEDIDMMRGTIHAALDGGPEGGARTWGNERTGASGTVTPEGLDPAAGAGCQRLRIANGYQHLKSEGVYVYCRDGKGQWKLH